MFYVRTKGQSTLEYVLLLGFVIAALIAMGVYMKRGTQGKLRESTDQIGEQYDAQHTKSVYTTQTHVDQNETLEAGGGSVITITGPEDNYKKKTGNETVETFQ
jgi:uncharacterized protein (UPF0333 family)